MGLVCTVAATGRNRYDEARQDSNDPLPQAGFPVFNIGSFVPWYRLMRVARMRAAFRRDHLSCETRVNLRETLAARNPLALRYAHPGTLNPSFVLRSRNRGA